MEYDSADLNTNLIELNLIGESYSEDSDNQFVHSRAVGIPSSAICRNIVIKYIE